MHQRVCHIVAVADESELEPAETAEVLAESLHVCEGLAGVV